MILLGWIAVWLQYLLWWVQVNFADFASALKRRKKRAWNGPIKKHKENCNFLFRQGPQDGHSWAKNSGKGPKMNLEFNIFLLNVPSKAYIFENENKKRQDVFLDFLEKRLKTIWFFMFLSKMVLTRCLKSFWLVLENNKKKLKENWCFCLCRDLTRAFPEQPRNILGHLGSKEVLRWCKMVRHCSQKGLSKMLSFPWFLNYFQCQSKAILGPCWATLAQSINFLWVSLMF